MKSTSIKTLLHALLIFIGLLSLNAQAGVEITYIHNDALGSPVAGTDEQGNVKWRSHYQPYGEEVLGERQLFGVRSGYTGHRDDPETGLTYMGARYYSPAIGRFMGVDPAGVDQTNINSFNRYAYANNNPYRFVDPDGQESREALFKQLGMPDPSAGVANNARRIADGASGFADAVDSVATDPTNLIPGSMQLKVLGAGVIGAKLATKLSQVKKEVREESIGGGKFTKKTKVIPGKGPGQSRSEMEFVKNSEGKLIRSRKFSFDRGNKFQHKKPARGGPEGRSQ